MEQLIKFEINKTYSCRSICDSNSIFNYTITRRTDKSIWINETRFAIRKSGDTELIYPEGRYSMCPVLRATSIIKSENDSTNSSFKTVKSDIGTIILPDGISEDMPVITCNNVINLSDYRKVI